MENISLVPVIRLGSNSLQNIMTVKDISNSNSQNLPQSITRTKQGSSELEYTVNIKKENMESEAETTTYSLVPLYFPARTQHGGGNLPQSTTCTIQGSSEPQYPINIKKENMESEAETTTYSLVPLYFPARTQHGGGNLPQSTTCTKQGSSELEYTVNIKKENVESEAETTYSLVPLYFPARTQHGGGNLPQSIVYSKQESPKLEHTVNVKIEENVESDVVIPSCSSLLLYLADKARQGGRNIKQSVCTQEGTYELEYTVNVKEENVESEAMTSTCSSVPAYLVDEAQRNSDHSHYTCVSGVGEEQEPVCCNNCGLRFSFKSELEEHQKIHKQEVFFECSTCNRQFTTYQNFIAHQRVHKGPKDFACNLCGKSFKQNVLLNKHMNTHSYARATSVKTITLPLEPSFKSAQNAERIVYKKSKDGHTLYGCAVCGKSYYRPCHLVSHRKTHMGNM
uniref:C2H2-type domain-containing protein n=1 Tax=Leptobrachium leishanense TaxID=445787 RepID=A0A8C5PXB4_9ANUR